MGARRFTTKPSAPSSPWTARSTTVRSKLGSPSGGDAMSIPGASEPSTFAMRVVYRGAGPCGTGRFMSARPTSTPDGARGWASRSVGARALIVRPASAARTARPRPLRAEGEHEIRRRLRGVGRMVRVCTPRRGGPDRGAARAILGPPVSWVAQGRDGIRHVACPFTTYERTTARSALDAARHPPRPGGASRGRGGAPGGRTTGARQVRSFDARVHRLSPRRRRPVE